MTFNKRYLKLYSILLVFVFFGCGGSGEENSSYSEHMDEPVDDIPDVVSVTQNQTAGGDVTTSIIDQSISVVDSDNNIVDQGSPSINELIGVYVDPYISADREVYFVFTENGILNYYLYPSYTAVGTENCYTRVQILPAPGFSVISVNSRDGSLIWNADSYPKSSLLESDFTPLCAVYDIDIDKIDVVQWW